MATDYYVNKAGGSNTNPGTIDKPWATINYAASRAGPGSTVYVRAGTYSEQVVPKQSGTQTAPITYKPYNQELVVLDGTNVTPKGGDAGASGLFQISNQSWITVEGLEITNVWSSSAFVAGIAVEGTCQGISISNNKIHDLGSTKEKKVGAHGISVYGTTAQGITTLSIAGNQLYNLKLGQSESLVLNGNVSVWEIVNNLIHDNDNIGIDVIGFEGTSKTSDQARQGTISGNTVYNISVNNNPSYPKNDNSADGIYVDGGADVLIERNTIHHCDIGLEVASEHKGKLSSNVTVRDNFIFQCRGPGLSIGGYSKSVGSTSGTLIYNNTTIANDTFNQGSGELQLQCFPKSGVPTPNQVLNNIFLAANDDKVVISSTKSDSLPVFVNFNLYWVQGGGNPVYEWLGKSYKGLVKFRTANGGDVNSKEQNPLLSDPTTPKPDLLPASPAIGAGLVSTQTAAGLNYYSQPRLNPTGTINMGAV